MNNPMHAGEDDLPEIDLSEMDADFADAAVEDNEFGDVPDGKYRVIVDKVELKRSKAAGNPMLAWALRILGPHYVGRMMFHNNVIANKENLRWLKKDLLVCGLELVRLSDLHASLPQLLDVQLEVTRRTRGEHTNTYFNKRLVPDEQGLGEADGSAVDDDIAF